MARATLSTRSITTTSGGYLFTATRRSSSASCSKERNPVSRGSPSCASARATGRPSPNFDPAVVAGFTEADVDRLLENPGIVRNRLKITSAITNARALVAMQAAGDSLDELFWRFQPPQRKRPPSSWVDVPSATEESKALAKALKQRGFVFVGPTTMYAAMQACGLVNDHIKGCVALKK